MPIDDLFDAQEISLYDLDRILNVVNLKVAYAAAKRIRENKEVA